MLTRPAKRQPIVVSESDEYGETKFRANLNDYSCLSCGARVLPGDRGLHRRYHMNKHHQKEETAERLDEHQKIIDAHADVINDHADNIEGIEKWVQIPEPG
jgi:hypothetical protein